MAADGSRSLVRQKLGWHDPAHIARLVEVLTPEAHGPSGPFTDGIAVFDFTALAQRLPGYYWDFPSLIGGQPVMNQGVFDSRIWPKQPRAKLKQILATALAQRQRDPLAGEGISFALGYGPVAAAVINDAFARQDFRFVHYRDRIQADPLLKELPTRILLARLLYGLRQPWPLNLLWRLSGLILRLFNRLAPASVPFRSPRLMRG